MIRSSVRNARTPLHGTVEGQLLYWNATNMEWTPTSLALLSPTTKTIAVDGIIEVINTDHGGEVSLGKEQADALLRIKTSATQWEAIEIYDPDNYRFMHFVAQGTGGVNGFSMSEKTYFALQNYTTAINYLRISQTEESAVQGYTYIETFGEVGKRQHLLLKSDGNLWLWPVNSGNILALEDIIPSPANSHAVGTPSFTFASGQFINFVIENSLGVGIETPNATLAVNGSQSVKRTDSGVADYDPSALTTDYLITVDNSAAVRAVTISSEDVASGTPANPRIFVIKDEEGAAGTYNITVSLESGGNIDGASSFVISGNYDSITLYVDGTNGYLI